jgi:hypothetical protein
MLEENLQGRLSLLAVCSLVSGVTYPLLLIAAEEKLPHCYGIYESIVPRIGFGLAGIALALGIIATLRINSGRGRLKGRIVAQSGVGLGILSVVVVPLFTCIPCTPMDRPVVNDAKMAVTQVISYAKRKGVYPTSLKVLREQGYAGIPDTDPWGNEWVLSPVLTQGGRPKEGDDVYVFSKGRDGTARYSPVGHLNLGDGAVGYSGIYGARCHRDM